MRTVLRRGGNQRARAAPAELAAMPNPSPIAIRVPAIMKMNGLSNGARRSVGVVMAAEMRGNETRIPSARNRERENPEHRSRRDERPHHTPENAEHLPDIPHVSATTPQRRVSDFAVLLQQVAWNRLSLRRTQQRCGEVPFRQLRARGHPKESVACPKAASCRSVEGPLAVAAMQGSPRRVRYGLGAPTSARGRPR